MSASYDEAVELAQWAYRVTEHFDIAVVMTDCGDGTVQPHLLAPEKVVDDMDDDNKVVMLPSRLSTPAMYKVYLGQCVLKLASWLEKGATA